MIVEIATKTPLPQGGLASFQRKIRGASKQAGEHFLQRIHGSEYYSLVVCMSIHHTRVGFPIPTGDELLPALLLHLACSCLRFAGSSRSSGKSA